MLRLDGPESHCDIPALVVQSHGRRQHFLFPILTLEEERYLVNLVYSRPEAWVYWHRSRSADRPLRSLARILLLSLRGIVIVFIGLALNPLMARSRLRPSVALPRLLFCGVTRQQPRTQATQQPAG